MKLKEAKRIIIKVGSSTLTYPTGMLNLRKMELLIKCISDLQNSGRECILVSSGAVAAGCGKLGLDMLDMKTEKKQAAAAVGQCELMYTYDKLFSEYNHTVAQILITSEDLADPERSENLHNTLARLLEMDALPIVNENDTVSTAEIAVGDNDTLAARLCRSLQAELLVILSDIDGLYTADPRACPDAQLLRRVEAITPEMEALAGGAGSSLGTGGMATKLRAGKIVTEAGADMVIANGRDPAVLYTVFEGGEAGTRFLARKEAAR